VWGFDHEVSQNNLEVFVRQLRHKVDIHEPKLIHTLRGFGYIMREP
jgi:DNA-binding response OmpR family regulator